MSSGGVPPSSGLCGRKTVVASWPLPPPGAPHNPSQKWLDDASRRLASGRKALVKKGGAAKKAVVAAGYWDLLGRTALSARWWFGGRSPDEQEEVEFAPYGDYDDENYDGRLADDDDDGDSSRGSLWGEGGATGKQAGPATKKGRNRRRSTPQGGASPAYSKAAYGAHYAHTKDAAAHQLYSAPADGQQNGELAAKEKFYDKDLVISLECELEKAREEVRASRAQEAELRQQLSALASSDKALKHDLHAAHKKNDQLDTKLQNVARSREQERQTIQTLEKKLVEEQRLKAHAEQQLEREKKQRRSDAQTNKGDGCSESCRSRRRELETELKSVRVGLRAREERLSALEAEAEALRRPPPPVHPPPPEPPANLQALMGALESLKEKNLHLQQALSAENRLKQDLFSALNDANRKLDLEHNELMRKCAELEQLRRLYGGAGEEGVAPPLVNGSVDPQNLDLLAMYSALPYLNGPMELSGGGGLVASRFDGEPTTSAYLPAPDSGESSDAFGAPRSSSS